MQRVVEQVRLNATRLRTKHDLVVDAREKTGDGREKGRAKFAYIIE